MMGKVEEVAAYVQQQAAERFANRPKKLARCTPERCYNVARRALELEPHLLDGDRVAALAIEDEKKVSGVLLGGIILYVVIQVIIKVLADLAIEYIKRKRAVHGAGSWGVD